MSELTAGEIVSFLAHVSLMATLVTSMLPTRYRDNIYVDKFLLLLNTLAGNVGKNKNADH